MNRMHKNYKVDEQVITNDIHRHIKLTEYQKQIKLVIFYTKFKAYNFVVKNNKNSDKPHLTQSNVVYRFICPFREYLSENNIIPNTYIGYTTTTLSRRLTYSLFEVSAIKQQIRTKHDKETDKLKSPDIKKILINNTKIIYKNNNINCLQILEAITIKKKKLQ